MNEPIDCALDSAILKPFFRSLKCLASHQPQLAFAGTHTSGRTPCSGLRESARNLQTLALVK